MRFADLPVRTKFLITLGIPVLGEIPSGLQVAGILAVVLGLGVAFGAVRVLLTRRG